MEPLGKRHCVWVVARLQQTERTGMELDVAGVASSRLGRRMICFPDTTTAAARAAQSGSLRRYIGRGRAGPHERVVAHCPWRVGPLSGLSRRTASMRALRDGFVPCEVPSAIPSSKQPS